MMKDKNFNPDERNIMAEINKDWWRGAVIYQIYPRSFQDSNGDGIGDLKGIISRLAYVASLGVDAIWISPFFTSPMNDYGYDISDYRDIDPMFGNLKDFDDLMCEAHRVGIKVMIDLVLSHSSDQHPWFVESRADKSNEKADWYVWSDAKTAEITEFNAPPNNWLSIFGGSAWQWDETRQQYYMHNFLKSQPDLNLHNVDVQNALLDVARFWMDKGVDGFRLDTINFYFHDLLLRDNPILPIEQRNDVIAHEVNPYNHQDHLYDKNQPENIDFLKRFRAVMEEYPAVAAVGEVGDAQNGMQIMAQYTAGDDLMQMCYAFEFLSGASLNAERVFNVLNKFSKISTESWSCWAFSNHDVVRHISRWDLGIEANKLMSSLILSMRGSVCFYQGEELGLDEADIVFEDIKDPYGKKFWPKFKGRDGCRTPMVWNGTQINGGFTTAEPWLPIAPVHLEKSVAAQENDAASMLTHYRRMIDFRKRQKCLVKGELVELKVEGDLLSFIREYEGERMICIFNMGNKCQSTVIDIHSYTILDDLSSGYQLIDNKLTIPAWQAFYAIK